MKKDRLRILYGIRKLAYTRIVSLVQPHNLLASLFSNGFVKGINGHKDDFPIAIDEHKRLLSNCGFRSVELLWCSYMQVGILGVK